MTGYRIPWVPILSEADLPDTEETWLVTDNTGGVYSDWRCPETGVWENAEAEYGLRVIAYAPLPAPYDPDEPEPVDQRDARIAELEARVGRLIRELRAFGPVSTQIGVFVQAMIGAAKQLQEAHAALQPGDLEVSE